MNDNRNNTFFIVVVAVVIAALVAMCACMFGLAAGIGIGQARARAQLNHVLEFSPDRFIPTVPAVPAVPSMPQMPVVPDLDRMMEMMRGAMVSEVIAGGPADEAGIEAGDLIVAVDGEEITPDASLAELIAAHAPGDEVTLTLVRMSQGDMNESEVVVVLGTNPNDQATGYLGIRFVPVFPIEGQETP